MNKYTYYTIPCIHNTMNPTATAAQTARPPMLVPRITPDGISFFSYIARARFLPASEQMNTAVLPPLDETGVW
mgnify:CR=1 FL=1